MKRSTVVPVTAWGIQSLPLTPLGNHRPLPRSAEGGSRIGMAAAAVDLLDIDPYEISFPFELNKQISCSLHLLNKSKHHVAFKVKTTNPKKYCVRPNSGIIPPRSARDILISMQVQREAPPDLQCKDKFLVQSVVTAGGAADITPAMFSKDSGNVVSECKLRVVYVSPPQPPSPVEEGSEKGSSPSHSASENNGCLSTELASAAKSFAETRDRSPEILTDELGGVRVVTLNRPKQLNALSFEMVSQLLKLFVAYEDDPKVKLVLVKGKGRAFCAGGDVTGVVHSIDEDSWKIGAHFFWNEFVLDYIIATYSKPQVSVLNGIVFGGGAGISIHGKFRIATENSVFAMPETALGLFPDIGASYFLSRLPGCYGEYVGLTGARLNGPEMLSCGLATHFVSTKVLSLLEEALIKADSSDPFLISATIDKFAQSVPLAKTSALTRLDIINKCFSKGTVEEIIAALEEELTANHDKWVRNALQSLKKASPSSVKITLRSIREGRMQGIGECLIREYRMVCHVLRKDVSKDFFEGCRAILIDKDKNPKWEPSSLEKMTDEMTDYYFTEVDDPEWEELRFPHRWTSNGKGVSKL